MINKNISEEESPDIAEEIDMKTFQPDKSKFLSSGKFGNIYLVKNYPKFIIKEISCERNKILMEENPILINVSRNCENLVAIKETIWKPRLDRLWVIMDKLEGIDLFNINSKNSLFLSSCRIISITRQLLIALKHLHENGIIHMDVKPENIRIIERNQNILVKLYDYGLARFVMEADQGDKIVGTPGFIAPEIFRFEEKDPPRITEVVDIWSLGATLFEILTGKLPHEVLEIGEYDYEKFSQLKKIEERLNYIIYSREISALCLEMLKYDPRSRLNSKELLSSLIFN